MKVCAVIGQKGGIGKTTTAVNLAACLTTTHEGVILVDTDAINRNATNWFEARQEAPVFDLASETDPSALKALRDSTDWDIAVVDTPGSQEVIDAVLDLADFAILPCVPSPASMVPLRNSLAIVRAHSIAHAVLLTRVKPSRRAQVAIYRAWLDGAGVSTFRTEIREYAIHEDSPAAGLTVLDYGSSATVRNAAADYLALHEEAAL